MDHLFTVLEGVDNDGSILDMGILMNSKLKLGEFNKDKLGGIREIKASAYRRKPMTELYSKKLPRI